MRSSSAVRGSSTTRSAPLSKTSRTSSLAGGEGLLAGGHLGIVPRRRSAADATTGPRRARSPRRDEGEDRDAARRWVSRASSRPVSPAGSGARAAGGGPGAGRRARRAALPAAERARLAPADTAATPPPTESASGIGERSGRAGERLGRAGGDERGRAGRRRDLGRLDGDGAVAARSRRRPRSAWWRCSIAACGWSVTTASFSSSRAERRGHVRRDQDERVADRDLAAPDVRRELVARQAVARGRRRAG